MERDRVKLVVMGLSYNQIRDGAYALMLAQVNGPYRIPVVIGAAEAQAIAITLENISIPRPLTHDLVASIVRGFGIRLREVFIHSFEDGVFSANMTFELVNSNQVVTIDSRTSDAIAIALRINSPIYTTKEILEQTGFILEKEGPGLGKASGQNADGLRVEIEWAENDSNVEEDVMGINIEDLPIDSLEEKMNEAVMNEDYETAAEIKEIIEKKRQSKL